MTEYNIKASVRENLSKGYRNDLIRRGIIPAVVYGKTIKNLPLEIPQKDVLDAMRAGRNTIINLKVTGNGGQYKVMVRDLQFDPVSRAVIHADLQQISLRARVKTTVPVQISGQVARGLARVALRELEIACLPSKIPARITVDVSGMKPGDTLTVAGLEAPGEINVLSDPETVVVSVLAPGEEEGAGGEAAPEAAGNEAGPEAGEH